MISTLRLLGGAFNLGTFNFGADTLASTFGGFSGTPASTSPIVGFRLTSLRPLPIPRLIVTTTQDIVDPNDGQISLREAIAYASTLSNQPIIHFSNHVARGAVNFYDGTAHEITLSGTELLITADMKIEGPGSKFLSINGNGDDRIFHIAMGQTVTLTGLSLFDGLPESQGGAILNEGILTLDRLSLLENGLILDEEPDPPAPFFGGAIYNTGILYVTNSTFADNGAVEGGAIYNDGFLSIINSTFAYNEAISGGAIYNEGTMTMTHVTFASNTADAGGGLLLTTPTINTAIKNSLIVDPIVGLFTDFGNNLFPAIASDAGLQVDSFGDLVLVDNGGGTATIALLPQSPALFAAAEVTEIKTDQRGVARSQGGAPDIGAYEAELNVVVTLSGLTSLFDGNPKAATVTTDPEPLDVLVTYDGSTLAPTAIGSYNVVALVQNPGLIGRAEGTLEIREIPSLIVTTSQDGLQLTDNQTSLREALVHAATLSGPQTITFSDTVDLGATNFYDGSTRTIALNGSPLIASSAVDIQGPGAERLTVSGEGLSRVFFFSGAFESTLSGVTITNGYAEASLEFGVAGGALISIVELSP